MKRAACSSLHLHKPTHLCQSSYLCTCRFSSHTIFLARTSTFSGVKAFEPGLLAKANRGILYVDEVNLLDDHLVDVLLDSAASGRWLQGEDSVWVICGGGRQKVGPWFCFVPAG